MAGLYFVTLAVLVVAAFLPGDRARAAWRRRPRSDACIRCPTYHGLLLAVPCFVPMLVVYAIATPLVGQLAISNALDFFPPDVAADALQRGDRAARHPESGRGPIRRGAAHRSS